MLKICIAARRFELYSFVPLVVNHIEKNLDITKPSYSEQSFANPLALRHIEVPLYTIFFSGTAEKVLIGLTCKCPCTMFFAQSERVQYHYLAKIGINEINYTDLISRDLTRLRSRVELLDIFRNFEFHVGKFPSKALRRRKPTAKYKKDCNKR